MALRFDIHGQRTGARARNECEAQNGECLLHIGNRAHAICRHDNEVHDEHRDQGNIGNDHELAQVKYGREIAFRHEVRDKGEHAVRSERKNHIHNAHDDTVKSVDELLEELRLLGIFIAQLQIRNAHDCRENDDRDSGRRAASGEIGEHIRRNETKQLLRNGERGNGFLLVLKRCKLGRVHRAIGKTCARQAGKRGNRPVPVIS